MLKSRESIILKRGINITLSFVLLLWVIKSIEWANQVDLSSFGILPRTIRGSIGILTGPLIHGDVYHLVSNSIPLIILGLGLFYFYHRIALEIFIWIYLASGFWVWIIGREAYHIGASGVVYGLMMYLFWSGILRRNPRSLAISLIVFFLYGGMIYGLLPIDDTISWESHLMGSLAGIFLAIYFRKRAIYVGEGSKKIQDKDDEDDTDSGLNNSSNHTMGNNTMIIYNYKQKGK